MFSNIAPEYYFKKEILEQEKNTIFKTSWLFVGFKNKLKSNNDFITRDILGIPVVVQNFKNELRAFLNVCSHRFSIIQQAEEGNRPMMCPYHGWTYDAKGIPTGIPKKPLFKDYSSEELCDLKLREYSVDTCGELVFVSITSSISLREYLGSFYDELVSISSSLGAEVDKNRMDIAANWKVIVENTLESYHVNLIHADSFRKLGATGLEFEFDKYYSVWDADLSIRRDNPANAKIDRLFEQRSYKIDGYRHILVFPNLLISSTHGTSYNFSYVEPLSPDETRFTSYVYAAIESTETPKALGTAFKNSLVEFNRTVFAEDKAICELVQKGVHHTQQQGVLSLEEKRVHHFQELYKASL